MALSFVSNWFRPTDAAPPKASPAPTFAAVYEAHVDFVWRVARRLGVPEASVADAVQDAFVVVHRKLGDFEGRSSLRTWLFGIVRRVARDHRPPRRETPLDDGDALPSSAATPQESAERAESLRALHALLETLDDERREVFVLSELEEMPMPEVAEALGVNVNTAYARLRAARRDLDAALARRRAHSTWRSP